MGCKESRRAAEESSNGRKGEDMPLITGINIVPSEDRFRGDDWKSFLEQALKKAACSIPALQLTENQVDCFFPDDSSLGAGRRPSTAILSLTFLYKKPERTQEVLSQLAGVLASRFFEVMGNRQTIEIFIQPFDLETSLASSIDPTY